VTLVISDVSEDSIASINKMIRIRDLGTTLALTTKLAIVNVPLKCMLSQEPHCITFQNKKAFFMVTAVKTSNLT
jgi:hypothetical protein